MKTKIKTYQLKILLLCLISIAFFQCNQKEIIKISKQEAAIKWAEMTLHVTQYTKANSPTFASRCIGYIGLTMYESIVHGYSDYNSLVGQLNGLDQLPQPEANKEYDWMLALNAGQAEILRNIYLQTADSNKVKIDSLEELIFDSFSSKLKDQAIAQRSVDSEKQSPIIFLNGQKQMEAIEAI